MEYKKMRRSEKLMSTEDTEEVLRKAPFGTLACVDEGGYAYSIPLHFVYENRRIYFHSAREGRKLDCMRHHPSVSFSAVSWYRILPEKFDTEYDSAVIFGEARCLDGTSEKQEALQALLSKYSAPYQQEGMAYIKQAGEHTSVWAVDIRHMTGKRGR